MILNWQTLNEKESDSAWHALEEWVWRLRSTYPEAREAVVDCWPAHPDLVQELTALYVWWEDIYEPLVDEVPDPDTDQPPTGAVEEATGRSAVYWHEALSHAIQRWRLTARCSASECALDRQNGDLVTEWRKRHARTMNYVDRARRTTGPVLGEVGQLRDTGLTSSEKPFRL